MANSEPHDLYADLLGRIEQVYSQIETLRAAPPSPKRDSALQLLEAVHARAILALRQMHP